MAFTNPEQLKLLKKAPKYRNQKTVVCGEKFDSQRELRRWQMLKVLQHAGRISQLSRQVKYELYVNGEHICDYVCDFRYFDEKESAFVVEDVKGVGEKVVGKKRFSTKTPSYQIKKKLMKALYGIEILET